MKGEFNSLLVAGQKPKLRCMARALNVPKSSPAHLLIANAVLFGKIKMSERWLHGSEFLLHTFRLAQSSASSFSGMGGQHEFSLSFFFFSNLKTLMTRS